MTKEQKFYDTLKDIFVGAKVEGESGYINLMKIKSIYYEKGVFPKLQKDIDEALKPFPNFREELFEKLYTFFQRYFSESGSIYFRYTPLHQNVYEKVYTDDKDVILFWKTHMLYYVKTDRLFKNLKVEVDNFKFFFDVSKLEYKRANEKKEIVYEFKEKREDGVFPFCKGVSNRRFDGVFVFNVYYSERGKKTKIVDILKDLKKEGININEDTLEKAFRIFEKQNEVDYFINKDAKTFLKEQFDIWLYQYVFSGESEWSEERIKQLQILKDISFKIIDFISQFEDELVKIWNKPKFVLNSNYVITLDRIAEKDEELKLVEKILKHENFKEQEKEWKELEIVGDDFKIENIVKNSPFIKGCQTEGLTGYLKLPYNLNLKQKAKELRRAGNLSEVLLWNELKNNKMLGYDFTRQQVIGNYIVDFHCPKLNLVIEIDGESHDFKGEYDKKRDEFLKSIGLEVLHFKDIDVKKSLNVVVEQIQQYIKENTPSAIQTPLLGKGELNLKYKHLPIDTKYFKDIEFEILGLFDDLDTSLDGWLIKSENYQALNTILPKFKEKVQTIYIDPPFNKESDADYFYSVKYKNASWITLLENRLRLAREVLNPKGSIFVRCDYNGNMYVRLLLNEIFSEENFRNEMLANRTSRLKNEGKKYYSSCDSIFLYTKTSNYFFEQQRIEEPFQIRLRIKDNKAKQELIKFLVNNFIDIDYEFIGDNLLLKSQKWIEMHASSDKDNNDPIKVFGKLYKPPKRRRWMWKDPSILKMMEENGWLRINPQTNLPELLRTWRYLGSDWTDIPGYSQTTGFKTENSEDLLARIINTGSDKDKSNIILDFFLGSGTTTAVAHKLKRKWIGVEMGEHFYDVILPRMKKVLAYDKSGISKEKDVKEKYNPQKAGGFFKYYELEQYEDTLRKVKYEDSDLFENPYEDPYNQYVFMRDSKMLEALEIDYKNNQVKVDLSSLYPPSNSPLSKGGYGGIDIPETLSNLCGKWIKRITPNYVEFEDGEKINIKDLDYKLIKDLIWW